MIILMLFWTSKSFLIHWKGRPESDYTWITREELQQLDFDLFKYYAKLYSPGLSLSHPRRVDKDIKMHQD